MSEIRTSLKPATAEKSLGPLVIVRPKALAEAGTTGIVASGIYEGAVQKPAGVTASGKKYKASTEYRIRDLSTDTLYILNDTQALKEQLGQLASDGSDKVQVEVVYNGKVTTANGNGYHDFNVFLIKSA